MPRVLAMPVPCAKQRGGASPVSGTDDWRFAEKTRGDRMYATPRNRRWPSDDSIVRILLPARTDLASALLESHFSAKPLEVLCARLPIVMAPMVTGTARCRAHTMLG